MTLSANVRAATDGRDARWERASLECCPPNLVRFLAAMPGFVYAQDARDAIYVNLYLSSGTRFTVEGREIGLSVTSDMPWGGRSALAVSVVKNGLPVPAAKTEAPHSLSGEGLAGRLPTVEALLA